MGGLRRHRRSRIAAAVPVIVFPNPLRSYRGRTVHIRNVHLRIFETIGHFIRKQLLGLSGSCASSQDLLLVLLDLLLHHLLLLMQRLLMLFLIPPHPLFGSTAPRMVLRHI